MAIFRPTFFAYSTIKACPPSKRPCCVRCPSQKLFGSPFKEKRAMSGSPRKKTDIRYLLNDPGSQRGRGRGSGAGPSRGGSSSAGPSRGAPAGGGARGGSSSKPFKCHECPRAFKEKGNLTKHIASVHEKKKDHACGVCGKRFAFRDGLLRHVSQVHMNERPYTCTTCGQRFKQASHLAKHNKTIHKN